MTSADKCCANRRNARAGTGPKTPMGKLRSARNARRHGLTRSARHDPQRAREIEALSRAIAGGETNAERCERADRIAAAQIEVMRVREARRDLLLHGLATRDLFRRMANLDRYERRALSRRKFAIRNFGAAPRAGW